MLTRDKLIRALRARGKSDQLAQMAADMLDAKPDGFIITERMRELERDIKHQEAAAIRAVVAERNPLPPMDALFSKPPAKKTPAKKAVKR